LRKSLLVYPLSVFIIWLDEDESNSATRLATRAGKMNLSCPLGTTRRVPQENFPRKPYNKSFIDQDCSAKIAGYWPRYSVFASFMSRSINTQKKKEKELGEISSHLDLTLGQ